jgi:hypothetical protein
MIRRAELALAATLAVVAPNACSGQGYPPSQRGSVTQHVALTEIAVTYGRPVAHGRVLFGQLVPWDSVWHPGADSATRISFSHDVMLEGHPVKSGEYTVWLIPRDGHPWTFILSRAAHVFHKPYPGPSRDYLRVDVAPETATHVESLMFDFPSVIKTDATLRIQWGETALPIHISAPYRSPASSEAASKPAAGVGPQT